MTDPVNLNQARKAKAKVAGRAQAAANRVKFGQTKHQQARAKSETDKLSRALDGARRAAPDPQENT